MTTKYLLIPNSEAVIQFCLLVSKTLSQLKQIHTHIIINQSQPHDHDRLLIERLLRLPTNNLCYARQIFEQIPQCDKNQVLWTNLIRSHTLHAQFSLSISIYAKMHRAGVLPNAYTLSSVLTACGRNRIPAFRVGKQAHTQTFLAGLFGNKIVQTTLLDMYGKCGSPDDARSVFDQMVDKDIVAWTAMISGYAKKGMMVNARELFDDMVERNVVSWTAMVAGYANSGDITSAKELFDEMPVRNSVTWTAMIAGYGKCGDVIKAVEVFDQIPACDHSAWAAMITCYGHNGYAREAIEMYKRMRKLNVKADEVSLVGLISACTQIGDVEMGNSIADQMEESSCNQSPVVSNALIHMHAKCGSIDGALNEFKNMFEKDVVSYSALITALADHGRANEALELFSRMQKDGVEPNQVTFVGVLNACSHAGLVHEGRKYFEMMTNIHGISPSTEHFACMVDILGRAGHIEEAYKLITDNVGIIDTGVNSSSRASQGLHRLREGGVWGALLGACRVHGNVELGEIAAKHLFEIEPENTGNYLLLASIYTSANRWDDAARMRKMMCEIGIQKSPGRSWVSNKD